VTSTVYPTTATPTTTGHTLRVTYEPESATVVLRLVCHVTGRVTCRLTCAEGCEVWDEHNHEHELTELNECNAVLWMDRNAEEYCALDSGPAIPLRDGMPVRITWDDDTYVWEPLSESETS
jgi:hypothetical protein